MLQSKPEGNAPVKAEAFLVAVEYEVGEITPEAIALRLNDSLTWIEGIATVEVERLGEITTYNVPDEFPPPEGHA